MIRNEELNRVFEDCLARLQHGAALEEVLQKYPEWKEELRPVLEAMLALWESRGSDTVPVAAMRRSREHLLEEAQRRRAVEPPPGFWARWFRKVSAFSVSVVVFVVVLGLFLTGWASVKALPGEALYPVKLAAEQITLNLSASPSQRMELEDAYNLRRAEEVEALIQRRRKQEVAFSGYLAQEGDHTWRINGIPLDVPPGLENGLRNLAGSYVYVRGTSTQDGHFVLEWADSWLYTLSGKVQAVQDGRLRMNDLWVVLNPEVVGNQRLEAGQEAVVSVIRLADHSLLAVKITLKTDGNGLKEEDRSGQEMEDAPTSTMRPTGMVTPQPEGMRKTEDNSRPDEEKQPTATVEDARRHEDEEKTTPTSEKQDDSGSSSKDHEKTPEPTRTPD